METQSRFRLKPGNVLVAVLVFAGLYLSSRYSYLLFHSIAEVFSVSVAGTIFMVSWNTRRSPGNEYFSFLGIGYLFLAVMDFLHLLAYKGMGVFPGYDANLPTQLWIAARYVMAVTFLAAPAFIGRSMNHRLVFASYATGTALLLASIFAWKVFPDCFIEGVGLTSFKIASEYVVSGVLLASIVFLARKREHFEREVLRLLVSSVFLAVCSEMAFTLYTDVYGMSNLVGHFLQILSFFFVYRAIVGTELVRKDELTRRLETELAEREIVEERTRHLASFPQYNPNPIVEVDGSGKIVFWNPAAEKMLETLGMDRGDVGAFLPADLDGILQELEKENETDSDREIKVKERVFGLTVHKVTQFQVVRIYARDITKRKRAEKELQTSKELLEERVAERTAKLSIFADLLQKELAGRRQAEESLKSQAALLKSVLDSVGDGVVVADLEGKFLVFNPAGKRILRQGATDTNPDQWADQYGIFLPDTATPCPTDRLPLVRAIGGESFDDSELFVRFGQVAEEGAWISCSGRPLKNADGVMQGGVVAFRDITSRKQTDEALRDSMTMLENIFSNIHLCVVYLDPAFNFIRVNKAYADSCGFPPEYFPGKNHFDLYPHAENESIFRKVVETGEPHHVLAKPFEFPDHPEWGVTYWDWSLLPLKDHDGKLDSLIFCLVDVTERRRAEEGLALNEERFRSLVTGSLVGILILSDGRIEYMNPEQKRLFGDLPDNFRLLEFPDVHPEDRARFEMFCGSILSEKSGSLDIDLRFYPFGGSSAGVDLRWVHCRATAIRSGAKKAYLVNMVDITRLKEMEHQIRIREKLASLGHVAAGIAHEIRSPLSGINIYLAALQQVHVGAEGMEPEARDQAAEIALQIQSAAHRIESVIKKVMDFTRPAAPRKELVDVGMAVENAIDFTAANLVKSGITLDRSRLVSLPKCSADLHMITQVVMNLISNAVHAMDDHRGPKTIEVSSAVENGKIVLYVSDSGPGVPPAIRDKIFDPFYTTRKDGYGIGLSFCRRVIQDHAGTLEVGGSRLGGAEFRIGIPLPVKGNET